MSTNGHLRREVSTYHETKPRVSSASFTRLSDLTPEATEWLWHLRIPKGELTIVDGDPSVNKSSLLMDLAARVSKGREMPDGWCPLTIGRGQSQEDSAATPGCGGR
jgi:hypothetical protein